MRGVKKRVKPIKGLLLFKLIVAFFVIVSPLNFLIFHTSMIGVRNSQDKIVEDVKSKFGFLIDTIEKEFSSVLTSQKELMLDDNLKALGNDRNVQSEYENSVNMRELKKRLERMAETGRYTSRIVVYLPIIGKCVSSESIYTITDQEEKFLNRAVDVRSYMYPFMQENGRICINLTAATYFITPTGNKMPSYLISAEMDRNKIEQTLYEFGTYDKRQTALIAGNGGMNIELDTDTEPLVHMRELVNAKEREGGFIADEVFLLEFNRQSLIMYQKSQILGTVFVVVCDKNQMFGEISKYFMWFWVLTGYVFFLVVLFIIGINIMVSRPLRRLMGGFNEAMSGNLNIELKYKRHDEFEYIYRDFNKMIVRIRELIEQVYELKILRQSAELRQLQYQISPHFLYNSLYFIYRTAKRKDFKTIESFSEKLGGFYRYITKGVDEDSTLEDEVTHAYNYISVMEARFGDQIQVEMDKIPSCYQMKMPKLVLQPLIENAFEHGIGAMEVGRLRISMNTDEKHLIIAVEDNGDKLTQDKLDKIDALINSTDSTVEISGMLNTQRRLRIKFGNEYGLSVSRSDMGGLKVQMKMPLEEEYVYQIGKKKSMM